MTSRRRVGATAVGEEWNPGGWFLYDIDNANGTAEILSGEFTMAWIPNIMVIDDDTRVLESLIPSLANEIRKLVEKSDPLARLLGLGQAGEKPTFVGQIYVHGFESERLRTARGRWPHQFHLHMVREAGGRFDTARRLLNQQLFAVVASDLRFSDDAGGQRAGKLLIDEVARLHPETLGILYSAYPRPSDFAPERFVRKGGEDAGEPSLAQVLVQNLEMHLKEPAVGAFVRAVAANGLTYQSAAFGTALTQVFRAARLLGPEASRQGLGVRRPLPCVLLDGESGTGKRGLAAVFHAASDRRTSPLVVASCNDLTNETLLRSILFGHKRGAFTDARDDRQGLVMAAGKGVLLLDDFHRLPPACSAIVHSFLEDGEFSRLGEEETRRHAECAVLLTVESGPWRERRRSGELPLAFLARVERLPVTVPPLRERPEDIVAQSHTIMKALSHELKVEVTLSDDAVERLALQPFAESNSRELRNLLEQVVYRHYRESEFIEWLHIEPLLSDRRDVAVSAATVAAPAPPPARAAGPMLNEWQKRLRALAARILVRTMKLDPAEADSMVERLFDETMPSAWPGIEAARTQAPDGPTIPMPAWEDLWRCFAVHWLGGPTPAEKVLGIPANTLRQWINDREGR